MRTLTLAPLALGVLLAVQVCLPITTNPTRNRLRHRGWSSTAISTKLSNHILYRKRIRLRMATNTDRGTLKMKSVRIFWL